MSSSLNSIAVVVIEADSLGVLKASKTSLLPSLPDLWLDKLRISKKIPGRTSVMLKDQGNSDYSHLKASRYFDYNIQLIIDDAVKVVETLRSLPAGQKEVFTSGFHDLTTKLQARTSEFLAHREALPIELPDPLP